MIKVLFNWKKTWAGDFKQSVHEFDNQDKMDEFLDKTSSNHSYRKLIGIEILN